MPRPEPVEPPMAAAPGPRPPDSAVPPAPPAAAAGAGGVARRVVRGLARRPRLLLWAAVVALLAGFVVGKRAYDAHHARFRAGSLARYMAYYDRARAQADEAFGRLAPLLTARDGTDPQAAARALDGPLVYRGRFRRPFVRGELDLHTGRVRGTPVTIYFYFRDNRLVEMNRAIDAFADVEPYGEWWERLETARHYGVFVALPGWYVVFLGALLSRAHRRRFGRVALPFALGCLAAWLAEPPRAVALFEFRIPHGLWLGAGMTLATAAMCFWPRPRRRANLCPGCGYDLTGNASGFCPECGRATPAMLRRVRESETSRYARGVETCAISPGYAALAAAGTIAAAALASGSVVDDRPTTDGPDGDPDDESDVVEAEAVEGDAAAGAEQTGEPADAAGANAPALPVGLVPAELVPAELVPAADAPVVAEVLDDYPAPH